MSIEKGDIVQLLEKDPQFFGALNVLEIDGEYAKCIYNWLDKPLDGDERPTSFVPTISLFEIKDLTILSKAASI